MENYLLKTAETGNWKMSFSDLSESEMVDIFESICLTTIDERKKDLLCGGLREIKNNLLLGMIDLLIMPEQKQSGIRKNGIMKR